MHPPIEESIANSPRPRITDYFSQGFNIVFKKPWHFIAATLMIFGIGFVLGYIPLVGDVLHNLVFQPLLLLGIFIVADRINYMEDINFDHFFQGFRENFIKVVLTTLLVFLVMALPLALTIYGYIQMLGAENLMAAVEGNRDAINVEAVDPSGANILMILGGGLLILLIALLYLFAIPMLHFKSLGPWQAMEASRKLVGKHFGHWVLFILMMIVVNLAGLLLLIVGLLVTLPATYAAIYVAFDDMVGARPAEDSDKLMDHLIDRSV